MAPSPAGAESRSSNVASSLPGEYPNDGSDQEDPDDDEVPWTTVTRRRSPRRASRNTRTLHDELRLVAIQAAKKKLTPVQRHTIHLRKPSEATAARTETPESSPEREDAPKIDKGKGIDPRNWGGLNLTSNEVDIEAQKSALELWSQKRGKDTSSDSDYEPPSRPKKTRSRRRMTSGRATTRSPIITDKDSGDERQMDSNPVESLIRSALKAKNKKPRASDVRMLEPIQQIAPTSYIGRALGGAKMSRRRAPRSYPSDDDSGDGSDSSDSSSDSSDDSSSSSSSSSSSDETSLSSSSSSSRRGRKHHKSKRSKKRAKSRGRTKSRSKKRRRGYGKLKPIPPTKYDGTPDSRAFHRFVTEGTAYVDAGRVPPADRVFVLSHYLTGKAHEFYLQEVSDNPYKWKLKDFLVELFNTCFPINFRTKQRDKLRRAYQNLKTVREFVAELNELWNLIGDVTDRDKVMKLWFGLNPHIQSELWRDKLNPEKSSLKSVVSAAEVIEIAHSVGENNNQRSKGRNKGSGSNQPRTDKAHEVSEQSASVSKPDKHGNGNKGKAKSGHRDRKRERTREIAKPGERITKKYALTKEEHDRRMSERLCFECGKPGHMASNCPSKTTVQGSSKNPPGVVKSYSIQVNDDVAQLEALAASTERVDSLTLGCMTLDTSSDAEESSDDTDESSYETAAQSQAESESDSFDYHCRSSTRMGDPLARRVVHLLRAGVPYVWDDLTDPGTYAADRFTCYSISDTHHVVLDDCMINTDLADCGVQLDKWLMVRRAFRPSCWYERASPWGNFSRIIADTLLAKPPNLTDDPAAGPRMLRA